MIDEPLASFFAFDAVFSGGRGIDTYTDGGGNTHNGLLWIRGFEIEDGGVPS